VIFSETSLPVQFILGNSAALGHPTRGGREFPRLLYPIAKYRTIIRNPTQTSDTAVMRRNATAGTAWANRVPITTPTIIATPNAVPRAKSTRPKRIYPRVENNATGIWIAWLAPIAGKTGALMKTKIGTSNTGPPVPVRAEPKPTITPIITRRDALKECVERSAEGGFVSELTPAATINAARSIVSTLAGSTPLLRAPNTVAGTIPAPSHDTILQSTLRRLAYVAVPAAPVKRKPHMLVAMAKCRSRPPTYVRIGGRSTPPMPMHPTRVPTIKAKTNSMRTDNIEIGCFSPSEQSTP
jgi:hypothetical protein